MPDTNNIRENVDLLKPLFEAKKEINELRYNLLMTKGLIDQSLQESFLNLMRDIEIKIMSICGIKEVNRDNFYKYEYIYFEILDRYNYIKNFELKRID